MKKIAILQSNYIPWKGYFDMIAAVDEFIIYDTVQYTKQDWRTRNYIKSAQGTLLLAVPVQNGGFAINEKIIDGDFWKTKHCKSIKNEYIKSSHFSEIMPILEELYSLPHEKLSDMNISFIKKICEYLGIHTKISLASDYDIEKEADKTDKLVKFCTKAEASEYISGPAAKAYMDESQFHANGISIKWFDYSGYPEYPQLYGDFIHQVSIIDLLFNCGKDSYKYMKHIGEK